MSGIRMEPVKAKNILTQEDSLENFLRSYARDVDSVRRGLRYQIAGQERIDARLKEGTARLTQQAAGMRSLRGGLEQVIRLYEDTENGICNKMSVGQSTPKKKEPEKKEPESQDKPKWFSDEWKDFFIKQFSNLVGPFSIWVNEAKAYPEDGALGMFAELIKGVGKYGGKLIDNPKISWKELFGWSKGTGSKGFFGEFADELGDFSSKGKTLGTITGWVADLIGSGISNYKEFGKGSFGNGRFWAETINEAGIKILEGAAIAAGVTAVIGSAPGVLVGAATISVTALVDWGLDSAVRFFTGDPTAEWVECLSDAVLDLGEKAIEGGKKLVKNVEKSVGKAVQKTKKLVKDTYKNVKEGISDLFSGCRWGKCLAGG